MNRREFLTASAVAGVALATSEASHAADAPGPRQVLELRLYALASADKQKAFDEFLAAALVPALNRAGVTPVGVFKMLPADNPKEKETFDIYVLLPHKSIESFLTLEAKLAADEAYQKAGAAVINAPRTDPAYQDYETELMMAFEQCPQVEVPTKAEGRLMQLRIYQNHNNEQARRKADMFNKGGEIALFRKCAMNPVFFGGALAGTRLPHLTYMLAFDSKEAQGKAWGAFGGSPEWKKIKGDPEYKDAEPTKIINLVLRPCASSQI